MTRDHQTYDLDWQGIALSVTYRPHRSAAYEKIHGRRIAHLEIRSHDGGPLPVTETGYRSRFLPTHQVEAAGGPVAYVQAWLDYEAETIGWERDRQLDLFASPNSETCDTVKKRDYIR